jgi:hypothetical protein
LSSWPTSTSPPMFIELRGITGSFFEAHHIPRVVSAGIPTKRTNEFVEDTVVSGDHTIVNVFRRSRRSYLSALGKIVVSFWFIILAAMTRAANSSL